MVEFLPQKMVYFLNKMCVFLCYQDFPTTFFIFKFCQNYEFTLFNYLSFCSVTEKEVYCVHQVSLKIQLSRFFTGNIQFTECVWIVTEYFLFKTSLYRINKGYLWWIFFLLFYLHYIFLFIIFKTKYENYTSGLELLFFSSLFFVGERGRVIIHGNLW